MPLQLNHLLSADDLIRFCKENLSEVNVIHQNLHKYFKWSNQRANLSNFYLENVSSFLRSQIQSTLGISVAIGGVRYLSHNLFYHKEKSREFKKINILIFKTDN